MALADYDTLVQRFGKPEADRLSASLADKGQRVPGHVTGTTPGRFNTYDTPTANKNTPAAQSMNPTGAIAAPVQNAATNQGATPALGFGGATYGSSGATNRAIEANQQKLMNDSAFKQSEIDRTLSAIAARKAAGEDTSQQEKYLSVNLGYTPPKQEQPTPVQQPAPVQQPTPVQSTPVQQPTPVQETGPSFYDRQKETIDQLMELQRQAQLQQIMKQRDAALQGLTGQETRAQQSAYDQRNQADAANIAAANRLRDSMAEQGLLNSGDNLTNLSALNAQRQSALGGINRQEASTLQDISGRRALINDNAAADEAALIAGLQAQRAQNMLDLGYQNEDIDYRDRAFDWQQTTDTAGLTGYLEGQRTLAGQGLDLNRDFGIADRLGTLYGQETLASQAQSFDQNQRLAEFAQQQKNDNWNAAQDIWNATGSLVSPAENWNQLIGRSQAEGVPLTVAEQQRQFGNENTVQQQQESALWSYAQQTGIIPDQLADIYGLPKGTPTIAAQNLLLNQDQNLQGWVGLDAKGQGSGGSGSASDFTPLQISSSISSRLKDIDTRLPDAEQKQYQVFKDIAPVLNTFPQSTAINILRMGGLSETQITQYMQQYANSGN